MDNIEKNFVKKAAALKYDMETQDVPIVTASGSRETAKKIIKIAEQNNIPIKKDEDLVNMLSEIELNQEIPVELYRSVAEIFSFIYDLANEENSRR